jgi:HK97 family phage major capsid protein
MAYDSYIQRGDSPVYDADDGASALIPEDAATSIIQAAIEKSVVMTMAKTQRMSRKVKRLPVLSLNPTAEWLEADQSLKSTSYMAWNNIFLEAAELAIIIPISENLLADSDIDLGSQVEPKVAEAFAAKIDAAILFGTNKPTVWPAALATHAIAAGNTVTQGAGVDIAADVNNVMAAVEADGFTVDGMAMRQSLRASFRGLRSTTNEFIFKPGSPGAENTTFGTGDGGRKGQIFDVPAMAVLNGSFEEHDAATANATKLIAGDWSQVIIGIRQDITVKRLTEASIYNASGELQFALAQQDMIALRFVMRLGYALANPLTRINSVTATRSPFAVLRDAA